MMHGGSLDPHAEYDRNGDALAAQLVLEQTEFELRAVDPDSRARAVLWIQIYVAGQLAEATEALADSMFSLPPPISDPPNLIAQKEFERRPAWVAFAIADVFDWIWLEWGCGNNEPADSFCDLARILAAELRKVAGS